MGRDAVDPPRTVSWVEGGGGLRVGVDPVDGARIVSLTAGGREWLAASRPRTHRGVGADSSFVEAGTGGWDEVVPTISACRLPDGTDVPDHGDAWRVPWTLTSPAPDRMVTTVDLTSLPVRLRRTIVATPSGLLLRWWATSLGGTHPLLWAAHPLFAAPAGTVLEVEAQHLDVHVATGGAEGVPRGIDGYGPGQAVKAFATGCSTAVVRHRDGVGMRLRWDPDRLPHLGLYWDRDVYTSEPVVALEPTTGPGDNASSVIGRLPVVTTSAGLSWWVEIGVDIG